MSYRLRRDQKKPPPPNRRTMTRMRRRVSVDMGDLRAGDPRSR
jgi:hypothetical protein